MDVSGPAPISTPAPSPSPPARRLLPFAVVAGLLAGVLAFLAGEAILGRYRADLFPTPKLRPTPDDLLRQAAATLACAGLTFAALGGLLGSAMGTAGGLARRSARGAGLGGVFGFAVGGFVGGSITAILVPIYYRYQDKDANDLILPLLTHAAIWSGIGAAAGLTFGLSLGLNSGRWKAAMVGGLAGAALAAVVYEVVGAVAFATGRTDLPLSATATTRATAHLLVALLASAGAALAAGGGRAGKARAG